MQASTRTSKVNKRKSAKADKQTSNRSKVLARSSIAAQDTKATRNLSGKTASVDKAASFEDEIFFSLQHQRNKWAATAIASMGLSVLCLASVMLLLPLKETRPYVVMVDKTTGEAEKIVEVRPTSLAEEEVVLQAELVSYISDRETYDVMDNATRIPEVLARSSGEAAHQLRSQWSGEHANYPPDLYGESSRILVKIKSITKLDDDLARVRFTKLREDRNGESLSRDFVATVQFEFLPEARRTLQTVWKNPLGFFVVNYRIDPETR
ncbi:type IV secretion system protein [uncultured Roseibium sp.]|uniref:virB8 family protein n=1 Tax=uncultured Roseibium sp. TaxID=1936171 RepID=UPI002634C505|nr:type IV secretion system protein [uncultured Roseibium sp.]